ncbi:zinc metalloproteinase nas-13 [Culicoides brevitarsis]|uniref:zinc metalloproteinase nas-13 n=1 Tax=Culicoides brevitarsis TaxID=469753 RepID=UPI00307BF70B
MDSFFKRGFSLFVLLFKLIGASDEYFEDLFESNSILDRNAINIDDYKWPNAKIPYIFSEDYSHFDRFKVLHAMYEIEKDTCVDFVEYREENDTYIKFVKAGGCGSQIGYRKNVDVPMEVSYNQHCLERPGAIIHELLHVTGLFHEQCRPDRDEHIKVLWDNIKPQFRQNFIKLPADFATTFDLPYDFKSLMHYPRNAFSKQADLFTMVALNDTEMELGQTEGPSFLDLEKVRRMYNCSKNDNDNKTSM